MMARRHPAPATSVLTGKAGDEWTVDELDASCEQLQAWLVVWVREQEKLLRGVEARSWEAWPCTITEWSCTFAWV